MEVGVFIFFHISKVKDLIKNDYDFLRKNGLGIRPMHLK